MKLALLKFLFHRGGAILTPFIAAGIAWLGSQLLGLGIEFTPEQQVEVTAWLTAAILAFIMGLVNNHTGKVNKEIQQTVGTKPDKVILLEGATQKAIEQATGREAKSKPRSSGGRGR